MPRSSRNINSRPQQVSPLADISVQFKHQGRPFGRVSPHDRAHTATALMWPTSTAAATTQTQFGEPPKRPPAALDNLLQTITAFNYSTRSQLCRLEEASGPLAARLRCPMCGSRDVVLMFVLPSERQSASAIKPFNPGRG
jgi:hypothetical protein